MQRIFLILLLLVPAFSLQAQEKKKILLKSAEVLEYDREINPNVQMLKGNVVFQHKETYMYCDSAYLYINQNTMDAFGNIHIKASDTTNLYGEKLHYDGDTRIAVIEEDVELIDNQIILRTDRLTYDLEEHTAYYLEGGVIEDPNNRLTSTKGYYNSDSKEFFFKDDILVEGNNFNMVSDSLMYNTITEIVDFYGNTKIISDSTTIYCHSGWYDTEKDITRLHGRAIMYNGSSVLEGDTLYYERRTGAGQAFRDVTFRDTTENIMLVGQYGVFNEADSSVLATDSAVFMNWEGADTLYLHGDTLYSYKDTLSNRNIRVHYNVRFFRSDMQGVCDSLYYSENDSLMRMYVGPVLWSDSSQLSADYMHFKVDRSEIRNLFMDENAFIISHVENENYQQIKGKRMYGYFVDSELDRLDVKGNAETIYFIEDDNGTKTGINKSSCAEMKIHFTDREVDLLTMIGSPDGTIYPYEKLAESSRKLAGFLWLEYLRPISPEDVIRGMDSNNIKIGLNRLRGGGNQDDETPPVEDAVPEQ
ncbi:MAG: hypothetical protein C0592_13650 [Marinilabiliales bacterium]|nr:MAG: hypothetical protein C0592_13650 [Marinilabiliales bacterium]